MKTGRNDPCFCGSGKKFKHCCLKSQSPAANDAMRSFLEKCAITFHREPSEATTAGNAMLLTALVSAWSVGSKLENVKWPVHVVIEYDGHTVCGTVEPATAEKHGVHQDLKEVGSCWQC